MGSSLEGALVSKHILETLDKYPAIETSSLERTLILGGSGHLGIWASLLLNSLIQKSNPAHTFSVSVFSNHNRVENIFSRLAISRNVNIYEGRQDLLRKHLSQASLILDLRLPSAIQPEGTNTTQRDVFMSEWSDLVAYSAKDSIIIVPSSGAVYGATRHRTELLSESDVKEFSNPRSSYGDWKLESEQLAEMAFRSEGKRIYTPRIFSLLGPFIRPESPLVANDLISQALKSSNIRISSGSNVVRSFASPLDVLIQSLLLATQSDPLIGGVNVGTEEATSILELARAIQSATQSELSYLHEDTNTDFYVPNLEKLRTLIGDFEPNKFSENLEFTLSLS